MATVVRENIGNLNDKISVKLTKEDYLPSFEKKLKEYSKNANIPGFRKGMVPAGMIKKMYGAGIFQDEVLRTVEKELFTYLDKERPDIFAQPLPLENDLSNLDMNNPADINVDFEIGLKPDFQLADLKTAALTKYQVEVTDAMIDDELNRLQIKGGNMTEPESIYNDENVINFTLKEIDADGNLVENGISKENSVLLKYFTPSVQKELKGKKVGDSVNFQLNKAYEGDKLEAMLHDLGFEKNDTTAAEKNFQLNIDKIGLVEKRALDEAFFAEVYPDGAIATESDFRNRIKEDIEKGWDIESTNQLYDQLYHYLLDNTTMQFPDTFLKKWMTTNQEQPKTAEEAEAEYPSFANQLKWTLISDKIAQDNKIEVSEDELRHHMKNEIMGYFGQMNLGDNQDWLDSYIDRMMKDEKQVDSTYRRLIAEKVFASALSQTNPVSEKTTMEDLVSKRHNHAH